jgi:hypothetical protein
VPSGANTLTVMPKLHPAGDRAGRDGDSAKGRVVLEIPVTAPMAITLAVSGVLCGDETNLWLEDVGCDFNSKGLPLLLAFLPQFKDRVAVVKASIATGLEKRRWDAGKDLTKHAAKPLDIDAGPLRLQVTLSEPKLTGIYVSREQVKAVVGLECKIASTGK